MIKDNILDIQARIEKACIRANRDPKEVTLIAVSKTKPVEALLEAYQAGMREFGENKVQEICEKAEHFNDASYHFHMIGHLQTNKVKKVLPYVTCIHSVESVKLAECIQKEAEKLGLIIDVLLEVNMASEESKFGLASEDVLSFIEQVKDFPNLRVRGLMTVAPYTLNPEDNRIYFRKMKETLEQANAAFGLQMDMLSMGMSGDFEIAIEEGATHVRVGTSIFGERNYNI